jgi:hypothetical protein
LATYSADISVKVVGLSALTSLEKRVEELHKRFTKINAAAANVTAPFQSHIKALERLNTLLLANGRLLNQQAEAVRRMERVASTSSSRTPAKQDPRILREQQEAFARQIQQLKQRADLLENNRAITDKLRSATEQLVSSGSGNVRLGKALLGNARALLVAEEKLAAQKAKDSAQAIRDAEAEGAARRKVIEDLGRVEAKLQADLSRARRQDERDRQQGQQQRGSVFRTATGVAGRAGGAVDRAFGGAFSAVGKAAEGAVIRGGAAAGVMGIGGMLNSMQNFEVLGKHLPQIHGAAGAVTDLVAALGNLPGGLGAAAVAAAAFAPWLPKIAQGALEAGEAVGKLEAAKPLKNLLNQGGASFYESPVNALSGNLDMALDTSGYEQAGAASGAAFAGRFNAALLGKLGQGMIDQLQQESDQYFSTLKRNQQINANWAAVLEEGAAHQAEITRKAQAEAAARAESLAALRATEQAASNAARQRLADAADARRNAVPDVVRRPIAGVAYPSGAGPAASPTAVEGSVQNLVRRTNQQAQAQTAVQKAAAATTFHYKLQQALTEQIAGAMKKVEMETVATTKAMEKELALQQRVAAVVERIRRAKREKNTEKLREKRRQNEGRGENLMLGVGFPLMFGAGAGSLIGSAAGSFMGSGFGGQIFGGAIGMMFDQLGTAAREAGNALRDPITNFEALKTAGLFASAAQEHLIERLIELGRVTEATQLIQAQVIQKVGASGARDLQNLDAASDKLGKAWAELNLQMQAAISGPLAGLLEWLASVVGILNESNRAGGRVKDVLSGLTPEQQQKFQAEMLRNNQTYGVSDKAKQEEDKILSRYEALAKPIQLKTEISPEELQKAAQTRLEAAERAEALHRQGIQLERQQQDARLQIEDQVYGLRRRAEDLERANIDLRRSVEDEIFRKRQELARIESDNAREQARLAIERLDNQLQGMQVSGNVPGQDIANGLLSAVRDYVKTRAEAEADFQQKERNFKIEMVELEKASDRFAFEVSRKVADLQRQSADYTRDVERARLTAERAIYDLQIAAADYRVAKAKEAITLEAQAGPRLEQTNALASAVGGKVVQHFHGDPGRAGYDLRGHGTQSNAHDHFAFDSEATTRKVMEGLKQLGYVVTEFGVKSGHSNGSLHYENRAFDVPWSQFGSGPIGQRDFARSRKLQADVQRLLGGAAQVSPVFQRPAAANNIVPTAPAAAPRAVNTSSAMAGLNGLKAPGVTGVADLMAANAQLDKSILKAKQLGLELAKAFSEMTKEDAALALQGQVQAAIDQLNAPMDQLLKTQQDQLAYQREYAGLISEGVTPALAEQLSKIREQVRLQLEQLNTALTSLEATKLKLLAEGKWTAELQAQLDLLKAQRGIIEGKGQEAEGGAMDAQSNGQRLQDAYTKVKGQLNDLMDPVNQITAGAEAIGSAFAESFKGVVSGAMTAQEAMANFFQRTAEHFLDMAAQMIAKYLEMKILGLAMSLLGGAAGGAGPGQGLGDAAMFTPMPKFADGGFVTGPTPALVGEGGGSEYIVPEGKMGSAMQRWNSGMRGAAVVDGASPSDTSSDVAVAEAPPSINITGGVLNFNDSQYIKADQAQSLVMQGAKMGEARTLRRLQTSGATRGKLGMR